MPIYQNNQTNLDFLHKLGSHIGYAMLYDLIKLLTIHGVDGSIARNVAIKIQRKVRHHARLTFEEKALMDEYVAKIATNISKANQTIPSGGDRRNKLSDNNIPVPAKNMEYKEGSFNDYVRRLPTRGKVPALKMDIVTKKSGRSPAMIRQLAYCIASA